MRPACRNQCAPLWKLPWRPVTWAPVLFVPAFFTLFAGVGVFGFSLHEALTEPWRFEDDPAWYRFAPATVSLVGGLLATALFVVPGILVVRRPFRARTRVLGRSRVPVSVYYARSADPDPTAPSSLYQERAQPQLLLVATDGRMWAARPDRTTFRWRARGTQGGGGAAYRNNPWIAPLYALVDRDRRPVLDQTTLANRRPPVDLRAPGYEPVAGALDALGQGQFPDPRFVGGPVPGELLLPEPADPDKAAGRFPAGLLLHRPADAPASTPPHRDGMPRFGGVECLFFGTDPGSCRGFYLVELAPTAPGPTP